MRMLLSRVQRRLSRSVGAMLAKPIVRLERDPSAVALTFDDGPDPSTTPAVLDLLAEMKVRATFFLIGSRVERHPDIVERMVAEGHAVGSHSYAHRWGASVSQKTLVEDWRAGAAALSAIAHRPVSLFRPPGGYQRAGAGLAIWSLGLRPVMWSWSAWDWRDSVRADAIRAAAARVVAGDIMLLHDGIAERPDHLRAALLAALPGVIAQVRARELRFGTLPEEPQSGAASCGS